MPKKQTPAHQLAKATEKTAAVEIRKRITGAIRWHMEQKEWKQVDLARATGESQAVISKLLKGKRRYDTDILSRIATALDLDVSELVRQGGLLAYAYGLPPPDLSKPLSDQPGGRPIPQSLRDFLSEHERRITPDERGLLVELGRSFGSGADVATPFWVAFLKLLRENSPALK